LQYKHVLEKEASMNTSIKNITRRTYQYWYNDGLIELAVGVLILLIALINLVLALLNLGTLNRIALILQPLVFIGGVFAINGIVKPLKERYVFPRTGYVAYHRPEGGRLRLLRALAMVLGLVIAIAAAVLFRVIKEAWIPAFVGLGFAVFLTYLGSRLGLIRFYVLAGVTILLGLAAAWLQLNDLYAKAFIYGGFGLALIVSGSLTLRHYFGSTQPPATGQE
jgi:hypothetical protein